MDAKTKKAWEYVKTLDYYSKEWDQPLEDVIYTLIDSMGADGSDEDRQQFLEGILNLKKKKRLMGKIEIKMGDSPEEEDITLNNLYINKFFKLWYWLPLHLKGEKIKDSFTNFAQDLEKIQANSYLQFFVNILIPIVTFIIVIIQFIKG